MPRRSALWTALLAGMVAAPTIASAQGDRVQVGFSTFHAAGLTTARAAGDSTDSPFLLVSIMSGGAQRDTVIPGSGQLSIRLDGTIAPRALAEIMLGASDSATVDVSVLEHGDAAAYQRMIAANGGANGHAVAVSNDDAGRGIAAMVREGAHHVGSVRLHLARTGGVTSWRRLECGTSCKVLGAPSDVPLAQPVAGVVELTGAGGVYHLQLRAARAP